jgi:hypothetical protein
MQAAPSPKQRGWTMPRGIEEARARVFQARRGEFDDVSEAYLLELRAQLYHWLAAVEAQIRKKAPLSERPRPRYLR